MFEMPIERGKVREFARAVQSTNRAFDGPEAVIPPTFLITAMTWEPPEGSPVWELGFDIARLLHGEEEYVFHGPPPRAGQTLSVTSRLGEQFEKAGQRGGTMRFAKIVHEYRDAAGVLVAEQHSTLIETAAPGGAG